MVVDARSKKTRSLKAEYFRLRDFEYAQPLYDLAFLLEVEALRAQQEVPKYRVFSLWKAAYRMDGYTSLIDEWLDGKVQGKSLDHVPSTRIRQYLMEIRTTGTLSELAAIEPEKARRILRLRSIRGLGASRIAEILRDDDGGEAPTMSQVGGPHVDLGPQNGRGLLQTGASELWQSAHIVPPILRFIREIEIQCGAEYAWRIDGLKDGIAPVRAPLTVLASSLPTDQDIVARVMTAQPLFSSVGTGPWVVQHQIGWSFYLKVAPISARPGKSIGQLAKQFDPLTRRRSSAILSDLHLHTSWSDGNADTSAMAAALKKAGREYFAVTDHSRSCKLQGGLTPVGLLRQATSLRVQKLDCRPLHGIEVDILNDGSIDLPAGLLRGMDFVIGSVHGSWSESPEDNTLRLIRAIESGCIDVLGHPTSAIIGKPGVPNYLRAPAAVDWSRIFRYCAQWHVALELNCFPSRLDLGIAALREATAAGCWISIGSDAHARSHLNHLRFGEKMIDRVKGARVLNHLTFEQCREWIQSARTVRAGLPRTGGELFQLSAVESNRSTVLLRATLNPKQSLPTGSSVVGLDLTAGRGKPSGVAFLEGNRVETTSLTTDEEIIEYIVERRPRYVSIDSPLGFPGGGDEIDPAAGIVRMAERDLASIGVAAYPALIDSMRELTIRGIKLKRNVESLPFSPTVIESYPGAAQDVLSIPRKQEGLDLLRSGLRELGLTGSGLDTGSHDEMDAITSAIVGRYFETGEYEPMGIPAEAQLVVPRVRPLNFDPLPVICLAGRSGSGKSVIARYLSVFYGFRWIKTRDVIRALLIDDIDAPNERKMFHKRVDKTAITENDLREFGVVVLEQYKQAPLREKLMQMITTTSEPIVVDSVRDIVDVEPQRIHERCVCVWYVESSNSKLLQRLVERRGATGKAATAVNPIDQKAQLLRENAHTILANSSSLEELRWRIDDALFTIATYEGRSTPEATQSA